MKPSTPLVAIIVLNYNGGKMVEHCIHSLFQLNAPSFRVIVVDNASTDGSFEALRTEYHQSHQIFFLQNSDNLGFARGMNVGIRFAFELGAQYIWLLNQDAIAERDSLKLLVQLFEAHEFIGMASPIISSPPKPKEKKSNLWFSGGRIDWLRSRAVHTKPKSRETPFETGFLSGCALMLRVSALRTVGLFDEHFFLYYEDADLSLRMKRAGFRLIVHPKAFVSHAETSDNNPQKTYWLVRSGLYFFWKHTPFFLKPIFWMIFFIRRSWNALKRFRSRDTSLLSVREAFRDFWLYGY